MNKTINGVLLANMLEAAKIHLCNNKEELNALNVFPVPDGDTGTNMSMTFTSAASAAHSRTDSAGNVLDGVSMSALRGARGNSGVILSQILRGMSKAAKGKKELEVSDMVNAFRLGSKTAYEAIMKPTEGTILTVIRMTAEHLEEIQEEITDLDMLFTEAVRAAYEALAQTPEMLPKLKQAGVVDSGGKGICYIIEGMANYYKSGIMPEESVTSVEKTSEVFSDNHENVNFQYCTEFIIQNPERKKNQLTQRYESLGDSIVVVAMEDIIKVHIHTNDPGIVISEALKIGSLIDIKIDNMKYQNENIQNAIPKERQPHAFVAVAAGEGFANIYKELGIEHIVSGGQSMNPSSDDILNAANRTNADVVYVFPNNKNIILAAEQAAELYDGQMVVIPTTNMSDVLPCMVCFDESMSAEENLQQMKDVIASLKSAQITYAVRDSVFDNIEIKEGEIMALSGSSILTKGKDYNKVCASVIEKLCDDTVSMVTVYAGADVNSEEMEELEKTLTKKYKDIDFSFYRGDQPVYYYFISLE
ncbi:MAG: DAK2 domain-containing protein [Clostridia bacterium]|nr:DAK2 domain-containing protein [Clostridia bacterium]